MNTAHVPPHIRAASNGIAVAAAAFWLAHPLQSEVIDYVTERTESMMGMFYLLTLYAAIQVMSSAVSGGARGRV